MNISFVIVSNWGGKYTCINFLALSVILYTYLLFIIFLNLFLILSLVMTSLVDRYYFSRLFYFLFCTKLLTRFVEYFINETFFSILPLRLSPFFWSSGNLALLQKVRNFENRFGVTQRWYLQNLLNAWLSNFSFISSSWNFLWLFHSSKNLVLPSLSWVNSILKEFFLQIAVSVFSKYLIHLHSLLIMHLHQLLLRCTHNIGKNIFLFFYWYSIIAEFMIFIHFFFQFEVLEKNLFSLFKISYLSQSSHHFMIILLLPTNSSLMIRGVMSMKIEGDESVHRNVSYFPI